MKTYSILLSIAAILALGSCSSAYRSAQTPDAVYYSPPQDNGASAQSDNQTVVAAADSDAGSYVVYDDGSTDNGAYYNDYFDNGYGYSNLYSLNNYYMNSPYGLGYNSLWNYSVFPTFSLGMNWGMPFGRWYSPYYAYNMMYSPFSYGMMYSPFSYGMMYNPYSPWYAYGGYPYYGGGGYYGYAGYGKYGNLTPRPAISWGPRRSASSTAGYRRANTSQPATGVAPRRVFTTQGQNTDGRINSGVSSPRRVFKAERSEQPVNVTNNRTVQPERSRNRIFRSNNNNNNNTPSTQTPRRVEVQRPSPTENRTFQQPTRTFESAPSSTPSRSMSAPSRTFSPRGR